MGTEISRTFTDEQLFNLELSIKSIILNELERQVFPRLLIDAPVIPYAELSKIINNLRTTPTLKITETGVSIGLPNESIQK